MADLITVRPGPVLHVWRDGKEISAVDLPPQTLMVLFHDLARAALLSDLAKEVERCTKL